MAALDRECFYAVVRAIPPGFVSTYGDIAYFAGKARGAREVGWALGALPSGTDVPWWRVVNALGIIPYRPESAELQAELLRSEGVPVDASGRLPLALHRWEGNNP